MIRTAFRIPCGCPLGPWAASNQWNLWHGRKGTGLVDWLPYPTFTANLGIMKAVKPTHLWPFCELRDPAFSLTRVSPFFAHKTILETPQRSSHTERADSLEGLPKHQTKLSKEKNERHAMGKQKA